MVVCRKRNLQLSKQNAFRNILIDYYCFKNARKLGFVPEKVLFMAICFCLLLTFLFILLYYD